MKEIIRQQEVKIGNYQAECEEMYDGIVKLEKCLSEQQTERFSDAETIQMLEERLKAEEKRRVHAEMKLEEVNRSKSSVDEENEVVREHYYSL